VSLLRLLLLLLFALLLLLFIAIAIDLVNAIAVVISEFPGYAKRMAFGRLNGKVSVAGCCSWLKGSRAQVVWFPRWFN